MSGIIGYRQGPEKKNNKNTSSTITADQVAYLLLLSDEALNKRIRRDIIRLKYFRFFSSYLIVWAQKDQSSLSTSTKKKPLTSFPGKYLASAVRRIDNERADRFCRSIDYCRLKDMVNKQLAQLAGHILTADITFSIARNIISGTEGGEEFLSEITKFLTSGALDATQPIPLSAFIKIIKNGLDNLCLCCVPCNGSGKIDEKRCNDCKGWGLYVSNTED